MRETMNEWRRLTFANPSGLLPTIRELHHAAQFVAMLGDCLLPRADDDSQTSLQWYDDLQGLAGAMLTLNMPLRLALVYEPFELAFIDKEHRQLTALKLNGQRKSDVLNWLRETVTYFGGNGNILRPIRHYSISHHATDNGASFRKPDTISLREMANYRYNAMLALGELAAAFGQPGPIRTWPHHFDTAVSLHVSDRLVPQIIREIEAGLAIPGEHIREPYFYVRPQLGGERLDELAMPALPQGARWLTGDWTGAVLPVGRLLAAQDGPSQLLQVSGFLEAAVEGSRQLVAAHKEQEGLKRQV